MPSTANETRRRIEQRMKKVGKDARASAASAQRRVRSLAADALVLGVGAPVYAMEKLGAVARDAIGVPGRTTGRARKAARRAKHAVQASDARSYEERTRGELYELAQERGLEGRSGMSKKKLIAALRR